MAGEIRKKIVLDTREAEESIGNLNEKIKETGNTGNKSFGDINNSLSQLPGPLGAVASGFSGITKAIKAATLGFRGMGAAIAATGIGALIIAIAAVAAAFKNSEEGQNRWNKIMTVAGTIVGNFVDLLADLGEAIITAFSNPQKALKDFIALIRDNLINRFEGLLELIPELGKAVQQLFEGNFKEAGKTAADAALKVATGIENATDKIDGAINKTKEFIAEQEREADLAAQVADKRAEADKLERDLLVERSKLEGDIAELRLKARQEDEFTAEQRAGFLREARELQNSLLTEETKVLELRAEAQTLENTFARSNKENLNEEARLIAEVNKKRTERLNQERQIQRELNTITKQATAAEKKRIADIEKAEADAAKKKIDEAKRVEKERLEAIRKAQEEEKRLNDLFLNSVETEFSQKKLDIYQDYVDGKIKTEKDFNIELKKLEIERIQALLTETNLYKEGSKERIALQIKLIELQKSLNDSINDGLTPLQKLLIDLENGFKGLGSTISEIFVGTDGISGALASAATNISTNFGEAIEGVRLAIDNPDDENSLLGAIGAALGAINSIIGGVGEILQAQSEQRIEQIDRERDNRIAALNAQYEAGVISEERLRKDVEAIDKEYDKRKRKEQKKAFEQQKALQIVQAVIATAQGVINAFQLGPIAGAVMAAVIAGLGAAQIGIIASQKFPESGTTGGASSGAAVSSSISTGGGGESGASNIIPPEFGINSGAAAGAANIAGQGIESPAVTQPQQVYVVETDITSTQNNVSVIETSSQFG